MLTADGVYRAQAAALSLPRGASACGRAAAGQRELAAGGRAGPAEEHRVAAHRGGQPQG